MKLQSDLREYFAEYMGTVVLLLFTNGIVAAGTFSHVWKSFVELAFVTGFGVTLGIYVAGTYSEAHLNPAITLAMMRWRKFPKSKVPYYLAAQVLGAISGSVLTYLLYQSFVLSQGGVDNVPQFFYTSPAPQLTWFQATFIEAMLTFILTLVIFVVSDPQQKSFPQPWGAILIGLTVGMLGSTFGSLTGFAMNPARDFGPRLFAYFAGWNSAFKNSYFLVPIFGPLIGASLAGYLYESFFSLTARQEQPKRRHIKVYDNELSVNDEF